MSKIKIEFSVSREEDAHYAPGVVPVETRGVTVDLGLAKLTEDEEDTIASLPDLTEDQRENVRKAHIKGRYRTLFAEAARGIVEDVLEIVTA